MCEISTIKKWHSSLYHKPPGTASLATNFLSCQDTVHLKFTTHKEPLNGLRMRISYIIIIFKLLKFLLRMICEDPGGQSTQIILNIYKRDEHARASRYITTTQTGCKCG